ncbi:MAG: PQQ-binding-like beta-propeller repeat protein [Halobaculum sp.]
MGSRRRSRRAVVAACGVALAGCAEGTGTPSDGQGTGPQTTGTTRTTRSGTTQTTYNAPAWFTDRGNLQHTASAPGGVSVPLRERWRRSLGTRIESSPVGGHGTVLVGANDGTLYALDPTDGTTRWTYDAGSPVTTAPTAVTENKGADEFVWVASKDGRVHSVEPGTGNRRWRTSGGTGTFNSAVNYATGTVYQSYMDGPVTSTLRAIDGRNGTVQWTGSVNNVSTATPMHGFGTVHVGIEQGGTVFETYDALSGSAGWTLWNTTSNAGSSTSGVLHSDVPEGDSALVITSTENGFVGGYTVGAGGEVWRTDLSEFGVVEGLALTQNRSTNTLVVAQRNAMYGLDPGSGSVRWTFSHVRNQNPRNVATRRTAQPAIYGDHVFQIVGGSELVALSLANGTREWGASIASDTHSSPLVGGNTVYVGDASGDVIAYSP